MKNVIIIPCYNEANRLRLDSFQAFLNVTENFTLCFVNDGSKDNTLEILKAFKAKNNLKVIVIDLPENVGKAEAVRAGVQFFDNATSVETIGFLDADLATGFDDYLRLMDKMNQDQHNKMVIGSRKLNNNQTDIDRSAFRALASNFFGNIIQNITKLSISDTQCGAKIFDRKVALEIFSESFISKWLFDVELIVRMRKAYGAANAMSKIQEVALNEWEEVEGSKITLKDAIEFPKQLMQIAYTYNLSPRIENNLQAAKLFSLNINRAFNSFL